MAFRFESMCIEINAPLSDVHESSLKLVKEKVLSFSHFLKDIVKAQIFLREGKPIIKENKVCEIKLTLYGDELFVHRRAACFDQKKCKFSQQHGIPLALASTDHAYLERSERTRQ